MLRPNKFQDGPISTDFSKFFDYMSYHRDIPISIVEETMCSWLILFYLLASKLPRPHYLQNYFGQKFLRVSASARDDMASRNLPPTDLQVKGRAYVVL